MEYNDIDYFENVKNHFIYIIHLINKESNDFNNVNFNKIILKKIIEELNINKNNILLSCNNITSFIN